MIIGFFVLALHGINVKDGCFQQDRATCHTSHVTINLLRQKFDGRFISLNGNVNCLRWTIFGGAPLKKSVSCCLISRNADIIWPPRSCDLTTFDYFLWAAVKAKYYFDKLETIEHWKTIIHDSIAEM